MTQQRKTQLTDDPSGQIWPVIFIDADRPNAGDEPRHRLRWLLFGCFLTMGIALPVGSWISGRSVPRDDRGVPSLVTTPSRAAADDTAFAARAQRRAGEDTEDGFGID